MGAGSEECPSRGLGSRLTKEPLSTTHEPRGFVWWATAVSWFIFNALIAKITARC